MSTDTIMNAHIDRLRLIYSMLVYCQMELSKTASDVYLDYGERTGVGQRLDELTGKLVAASESITALEPMLDMLIETLRALPDIKEV